MTIKEITRQEACEILADREECPLEISDCPDFAYDSSKEFDYDCAKCWNAYMRKGETGDAAPKTQSSTQETTAEKMTKLDFCPDKIGLQKFEKWCDYSNSCADCWADAIDLQKRSTGPGPSSMMDASWHTTSKPNPDVRVKRYTTTSVCGNEHKTVVEAAQNPGSKNAIARIRQEGDEIALSKAELPAVIAALSKLAEELEE